MKCILEIKTFNELLLLKVSVQNYIWSSYHTYITEDYSYWTGLLEGTDTKGSLCPITVNIIPTRTYSGEHSIELPSSFHQCAICLEDYEIGDTLRQLPCIHEYHKNCIGKKRKRQVSFYKLK